MTHNNYATEEDWKIACGFYQEHRLRVFLALFARSLPATFCSASGAAILAPGSYNIDAAILDPTVANAAHRMIGDAYDRLYSTLGFLDRTFSGKDRTRAEAISGVNDAHARVVQRFTTLNDPQFLPLHDPVHIIGAAVSFVVPIFEMFDEWCPEIVEERRECADSWARVWMDLAVMLEGPGGSAAELKGHFIDKDCSYQSVKSVADKIEKSNRQRTYAGVRLMNNLIVDMRDGLPRREAWMIDFGIALFGEVEVLETLLVPRHRFVARSRPVLKRLFSAPLIGRVFWWQNERVMRRYLKLMKEEAKNTARPIPKIVIYPPNGRNPTKEI